MRRLSVAFAFLLQLALVSACATQMEQWASERVDEVVIREPSPQALVYCTNYGCEEQHLVSLTEVQWTTIKGYFSDPHRTAAEERLAIAKAAGDYERFILLQTGIGVDVGGTLVGYGRPGQTDCVDETANMIQFLVLLDHHGLLLHHTVDEPVLKDPLVEGWFHFTATIKEHESGEIWSVDSWYFDSGHPAIVLPIDMWREDLEPLAACMKQDGGEGLREQSACAEAYPTLAATSDSG